MADIDEALEMLAAAKARKFRQDDLNYTEVCASLNKKEPLVELRPLGDATSAMVTRWSVSSMLLSFGAFTDLFLALSQRPWRLPRCVSPCSYLSMGFSA